MAEFRHEGLVLLSVSKIGSRKIIGGNLQCADWCGLEHTFEQSDDRRWFRGKSV